MPRANGADLLLPPGANLEGAYQNPQKLPNPPPGQLAKYKIGGDNYEVVITAVFVVTTDATAITRGALFSVQDADGNLVMVIPAPAAHPPSTTVIYQYASNVGTYSANSNTDQLAEIPILVLYPGWTVNLGLLSGAAGDQVLSPYIVTQRFPTGTPASQNRAPVAPVIV